jgi:hypothetical protein
VRRHRERRREKLRLITIPVPEPVIDNAIARGLLKPADRAQPWAVIEGCYAVQLSDAALDWLISGGVIKPEQRGDAAAIFARHQSLAGARRVSIKGSFNSFRSRNALLAGHKAYDRAKADLPHDRAQDAYARDQGRGRDVLPPVA